MENNWYYDHDLADRDFASIRNYFEQLSGISLGDSKKALVQGRLIPRLRNLHVNSYSEYLQYLQHHPDERQFFVDVMTTHETRFYREPVHFDFLSKLAQNQSSLRIWSAACSTGEEPYTISMVLSEIQGLKFEILASDISIGSMSSAKEGIYHPDRCKDLPKNLADKYLHSQGNSRLLKANLKTTVHFRQINLMESISASLGVFDVVFLRNMLIYFDQNKQKKIVGEVIKFIKPGGYLFIGHSEALLGFNLPIKVIRPSIYQKI